MSMYNNPNLVNMTSDAIFLDGHFDLLGSEFVLPNQHQPLVHKNVVRPNLQLPPQDALPVNAQAGVGEVDKEARLAQRMLKKKCREKQRRLVRSFALNCLLKRRLSDEKFLCDLKKWASKSSFFCLLAPPLRLPIGCFAPPGCPRCSRRDSGLSDAALPL